MQRPDLFVAVVDPASADAAAKLVAGLRKQGLWIEQDTRGGSVKSQMKRADKTGARFAIVLGDKEISEQAAQLKPMGGGEPRLVPFAELPAALKQ